MSHIAKGELSGGLVQLPISIDRDSNMPFQDQLINKISELITNGVAKPGMRIPASRSLCRQLKISRNTVKHAYDVLMSQGYLVSLGTSGTFINTEQPDKQITALTSPSQTEESSFPIAATRFQEPLSPLNADKFDFSIQNTNPALAPERTWRRLLIKYLPFQSRHANSCDPAGLSELRRAITNSISPLRGMSVKPENCVIVQDDYRAIDTISRLLVYRNKNVAVEDPCDAGLYYLLCSQGAKPVPIPIDEQGLSVKHLKKHDVSAVFVSPSHQLPTGITMSRDRRMELLDWAYTAGSHIVEWDTFGEFCYDDSPLPSLFSLDKSERVIYLNSFSSWIGANTQLCYMVLPSGLISQFLAIRNFLNPLPSWLDQRIAADFISNDSFFNQLRRIRQHYKQLRNHLLMTMDRCISDVNISGQQAGRHILWHLPRNGSSALDLQAKAQAAGVYIPTLYDGYCCLGKTNNRFNPEYTLLLGYSGVNDEQVRSGIPKLAGACGFGPPSLASI